MFLCHENKMAEQKKSQTTYKFIPIEIPAEVSEATIQENLPKTMDDFSNQGHILVNEFYRKMAELLEEPLKKFVQSVMRVMVDKGIMTYDNTELYDYDREFFDLVEGIMRYCGFRGTVDSLEFNMFQKGISEYDDILFVQFYENDNRNFSDYYFPLLWNSKYIHDLIKTTLGKNSVTHREIFDILRVSGIPIGRMQKQE